MSLLFKDMFLENFRTFRQRVAVPLQGLGLVLIKGDNRVSAAMNANAVGKTSLFHGISWVLHGEDLDGVSGEDVACRFTKGQCIGGITVLDDVGKPWTVERFARPSGVRLSGNGQSWESTGGRGSIKEINAKIEQLIGWGAKTTQHALFFGFERFAKASQDEQMRMLDEIQGWDSKKALERTKAWAKTWRDELVKLTSQSESLDQRIRTGVQQATYLKTALESFQQTKSQKLAQYEREINDKQNRLPGEIAVLAALKEKALSVATLTQQWQAVRQRQISIEAMERECGVVRYETKALETKYNERLSELQTLLAGGTCPKCRTVLTGAVAQAVTDAFQPDIKSAEIAWTEKKAILAKRDQEIVDAHVALSQELAKLPPGTNDATIRQAQMEVSPQAIAYAQREIEVMTADIGKLKTDYEALRSSVWEGQAALDAATRQVAEAELAKRGNELQIARAKTTIKVADYWIEAFGDRGIRSLMFESVAPFLNVRLSEHLMVLAAGEVQARLSPFSQLKSGATKEKLSLTAMWDFGSATYASGSGGQDRRIDLALFAALQDLAESRSARPFPIKAWDQPDDHLDEQGQEIFCKWIEKEARERSTGFLITHSAMLGNMVSADQVWTVVLDDNGSRIEGIK